MPRPDQKNEVRANAQGNQQFPDFSLVETHKAHPDEKVPCGAGRNQNHVDESKMDTEELICRENYSHADSQLWAGPDVATQPAQGHVLCLNLSLGRVSAGLSASWHR